jgi:hypothetical protein
MLVTFLVRGTRVCKSTSRRRSARAQHGRIPFPVTGQIKRASNLVSAVRIHPKEQINGWWEIVDSEAMPRLAQWIAPILCAGKDSSHPSIGRVARDLVASAFRHSGVRRVRVSCCSTSQNPEPRKRRKSSPRYHGAFSAVCPKKTPGAQLSHLVISPIATPRRKEQLCCIPDT